MEVTGYTSPQTTGVITVDAADGAEETTGTDSVLSSDFETFLVMLTAQIQNQDPLSPLESTDYAVQLATFSGVEQQVQTNELLRALDDSSVTGLAEFAGWVDMEARVEDAIYFDGEPVTLNVDPPEGATGMSLVVSDEGGNVISRIDIGSDDKTVSWDGKDSDGAVVEPGLYNVSLIGSGTDGEPFVSTASSYLTVTEVRSGETGPEIVLAGGMSVAPEAVTALRAAGTD